MRCQARKAWPACLSHASSLYWQYIAEFASSAKNVWSWWRPDRTLKAGSPRPRQCGLCRRGETPIVETARASSHALDPKRSFRAAIGGERPASAATVLQPPCHNTQGCVIKCEHRPSMERGLHFAGFGLEFARISKPAAPKKYVCLPPLGGCAPAISPPLIRARLGRTASRTLFRHAKRLAGNSGPASPSGFEVLVDYALNSIELTNPFLRFPRVRQQTRGNFLFQYL
jgi:hypothetical protein